MKTTAIELDQFEAQQVWAEAEMYLRKAVTDDDPDTYLRGVQARVFAGLVTLWKVVDEKERAVAWAISILYTVDGVSNIAQLSLGTAEDLNYFLEHDDEFVAWALQRNVEYIEVIGRKGWEKILKPLGFIHNHTSLMRHISEELH